MGTSVLINGRWYNISDLKRAPIALPPKHEQATIAEKLNALLARIDAAVTRSTNMIGCLTERRSALITAAVTGQINVTQSTPTQAAA